MVFPSCLDAVLENLYEHCEHAYWLWHDVLNILDLFLQIVNLGSMRSIFIILIWCSHLWNNLGNMQIRLNTEVKLGIFNAAGRDDSIQIHAKILPPTNHAIEDQAFTMIKRRSQYAWSIT